MTTDRTDRTADQEPLPLRRAQTNLTEERIVAAATELFLASGYIDTTLEAVVFAHNDLTAVGVLDALRAAGRVVPDDVAVVGFDDIPVAAHTQPALTTVRQPSREMGEKAASMLLATLAGESLPEDPWIVPTSLVIRESTA